MILRDYSKIKYPEIGEIKILKKFAFFPKVIGKTDDPPLHKKNGKCLIWLQFYLCQKRCESNYCNERCRYYLEWVEEETWLLPK